MLRLGAVLGLGSDTDYIGFFAVKQFAIIGVLLLDGDVVASADLGHDVGAQIRTGDQIRTAAGFVAGGV